MQLTKEELEIKELGLEAKGFLESKLFKWVQAKWQDQLEQEYPDPVGLEWQDKYRNAKAFEKLASIFVQTISSLHNQYLELCNRESEDEPSITEDA